MKEYFTWSNHKSNWMKWVILIPACLVIFVLASPLTKIIYEFSGKIDTESFLYRYISAATAGLTTGISTIYLATYIAPKFKKVISVFFAVAIVLLTLWVMIFVAPTPDTGYSQNTENIAVIVGSIGMVIIRNEKK